MLATIRNLSSFPAMVARRVAGTSPRRKDSRQENYDRCVILGRDSANPWIRISSHIPGWLIEGEHEFLYAKAMEAPPGQFVEIGSLYGKSSSIIAGAIKDRSSGEKLWCIDPFTRVGADPSNPVRMIEGQGSSTFHEFIAHSQQYGFHDVVIPVATYSELCLPYLPIAVSFAFIDGLHEAPAPLRDFRMIDDRIVLGGIVAFHDAQLWTSAGVAEAVAEVERSYPNYDRLEGAGTIAAFRKTRA